MLLSWIITMALGYAGVASAWGEWIEGIDPELIPVWPYVTFLFSGLSACYFTWRWAFTGEKVSAGERKEEQEPSATLRRSFLKAGAALVGGGAGVLGSVGVPMYGWRMVDVKVTGPDVEKTSPSPRQEWSGSRVRSWRELGTTGFQVSDISIGTSQFLRHPKPDRYLGEALDRGINYIDTSPDYAGALAERTIGKALSGRNREALFLATKWCTSDGHVRQGASVQDYISCIEDSLKRLDTDYVDLVHIHACDSVERLLDPGVHEAFARLKEQGKVRFMGVSTHTPNLEQVAGTAIDSGLFDVMMLAYHHGAWPLQDSLIRKAADQGIGIVAMKTLKGAKHRGLEEFRPEEDSFAQAAFKWVLSNPAVSCLVVSFHENQHLDEYLYASGQTLTASDLAVLETYDRKAAGTHCLPHCGSCLESCPQSLPIHDVLRYRMYFEDYGDQKQAMQLYSKLETNASQCLTCPAPCTGACPAGIDIKQRMLGAHQRLTFT